MREKTYHLARQLLPKSEFPIVSYPYAKEFLMLPEMKFMREKMKGFDKKHTSISAIIQNSKCT